MKILTKILAILCLFSVNLFSQIQFPQIEKIASLFPERKDLEIEPIDWYYLSVPENWDITQGKQIKIAVAVLKSNSENKTSNPVIFIAGGPGSGGIRSIGNWLKHPLRKNNDIILVDVRGTGFSLPRFCPELGKKFLEILSKNQNAAEDEQQKIIASMACKQDLIDRGIDINAYNSKSIAKDLNALKQLLKYDKWNVYGVSYGTYLSQVYVNDFPQDIETLILDSSIPDISEYYYNHSTTNFMQSLEKVFESCKNDPACNAQYPNLEETFYEVIDRLDKKPITVKVDKKIIPGGLFTYNAEDFKICTQQALYKEELIEVLPLLITEFKKENKHLLASLVRAFSESLSLDYGTFYCVTCNEAFPFNSISAFEEGARRYKRLKGGLSFYKSDFAVCDKWNADVHMRSKLPNDLSNMATLLAPVLVFSGKFDPVTPPSNGRMTVDKFKNGFLINAPVSGHGPSFSKTGRKIVCDFISNSDRHPDIAALEADSKVHFITDVKMQRGISELASSLNELNFLFFAPLILAFIILLIAIPCYSYSLIRKRGGNKSDAWIKRLLVLSSILALISIVGFIVAINNTASRNLYIIAFGLPEGYAYLFTVQWAFVILTLIALVYFMINIKKISNVDIIATILFSLILTDVYFQYWGFLF